MILDCGANNGRASLFWNSRLPKATIYAVEADPAIANILQDRVKDQPNIFAFCYALCDRNDFVSFYPNIEGRGNSQGSIYQQGTPFAHDTKISDEPIIVPSRTLDRFCEESGIAKIDFLFLDMQGAELVMLKESTSILPKVSLICSEVLYDPPLYKGAPTYSEVQEFLEKVGFIEIHHKSFGRFGDSYFVRKDLYQEKN